MSSPRRVHAGKAALERQKYHETRVRRQLAEPTYDDESLVFFDPTTEKDVLAISEATEVEATGASLPRRRATKAPSAVSQFLRERWPEIVMLVILVALVGQVFSLNREVGELGVKINALESRLTDLREDVGAEEERLRDEVNRLRERLDRQIPPSK